MKKATKWLNLAMLLPLICAGFRGAIIPAPALAEAIADYTVMIYLNGSDLESEDGLASDDLLEMMTASESFDSESVQIIVQTGGTAVWQTEGIPSDATARYLIADGGMYELEQMPLQNIGEPDTLTDFIVYAMDNFPAERYALILWNHGGGAVSGYGVDELFDYDGLTLSELDSALFEAGLYSNKLELIGFDACLMATLETATVVSEYAHYLVASEELEPGYGWHYEDFLYELGENPGMDGAELGEHIATGFVDFYNDNDMADELTTLSVTDLSKIATVVSALEDFVSVADASLIQGNYRAVARPRSRAFEFGMPTAYGGSTDMIDIVDMANQFSELCTAESNALIDAINDAVVFKAQGKYVQKANGLSLYFPFTAKDEIPYSIAAYQETGFSPAYINYVTRFSEMLTGESLTQMDVSTLAPLQSESGGDVTITLTEDEIDNISEIYFSAWVHVDEDYYLQVYQDSYVEIDEYGVITTEFDGMLTTLGGELACLIEIGSGEDYVRYAASGLLNGQKVNFIVLFDEYVPNGKVLGAVPIYDSHTNMPSKQTIPIQNGDGVAFSYYMARFTDVDDDSQSDADNALWFDGDTFTVSGELTVETFEVTEGTYLYGFEIIDYQGNTYYTDFIEMTF